MRIGSRLSVHERRHSSNDERHLVDTHVFPWFESDSPLLSKRARTLIERTDKAVYLSAVSFWEIAIQAARRQARLRRLAARGGGFIELAIDALDAETAGALEWHHRDPFDRMLVAQCLNRSLTLVTANAALRVRRGIPVIWAG